MCALLVMRIGPIVMTCSTSLLISVGEKVPLVVTVMVPLGSLQLACDAILPPAKTLLLIVQLALTLPSISEGLVLAWSGVTQLVTVVAGVLGGMGIPGGAPSTFVSTTVVVVSHLPG